MLKTHSNMTRCPKSSIIFIRVFHTTLTIYVSSSLLFKKTEIRERLSEADVLSILYVILYYATVVLSLVMYSIACWMDPGFVPIVKPKCPSEESDIEEKSTENCKMLNEPKLRHCGFCGIEQPLRSRHCEDCGRCVRRFDHHCPWLGSCVGELNHRYFLIFLISTTSVIAWTAYIIWNAFVSHDELLQSILDNILLIIDIPILIFGGFAVVCLVFVHIYLAICNVTTWEFVSSHRISYLKEQGSGSNPFHLGYCKNLFVFLCACSVQNWEKIYVRYTSSKKNLRSNLEA